MMLVEEMNTLINRAKVTNTGKNLVRFVRERYIMGENSTMK
jgi:hypothetical protein